jgi:hypothetical protein
MKKFLLPLVALFTLAVPAVAEAHTVNLSVACGKATASWTLFAPAPAGSGRSNTVNYLIEFQPAGGGTLFTAQGTVTFTGSSATKVIALPQVNGTVIEASSWWYGNQTVDGNSNPNGTTAYNIPITGCATTTTTTTTTPTTTTTTTTSTTTTTTTTTPTTTTTTTTPTTTTTTTPVTTTTTTPVTTTTTSTTTTATPNTGVEPFSACVAPKVTLTKTNVSKNNHFTAVVHGTGIKSVVFSIDGRKVKTLTKPNSGSAFSYAVPVSKGRYGSHQLTAKITTNCGSPKTDGLSYSRVAAIRTVVPKFTG